MNWYQILNVIVFIIEKILKDEDQNGKPDILER